MVEDEEEEMISKGRSEYNGWCHPFLLLHLVYISSRHNFEEEDETKPNKTLLLPPYITYTQPQATQKQDEPIRFSFFFLESFFLFFFFFDCCDSRTDINITQLPLKPDLKLPSSANLTISPQLK